MRIEWSENCVHQHDGWQVMFWDMSAALQLLREEYPWFLETFQGYKRRVQQGMLSSSGIYCQLLMRLFRVMLDATQGCCKLHSTCPRQRC